MSERGKIHSPELASQLRDFSGLRWGKITPTDIDMYTDFGDRLMVFGESKLPDVQIQLGQELALARLVDAIECEKRHAIGIVYEHDNREGEIDFANCIVVKFRWLGAWHKPQETLTVREAVDKTLRHCELNHYLGETP